MDTARARAEAALRRDATLEAVAFAAQRFLEEPDPEALTPAVLRRLGEATGVSRVYVYENGLRDGQLRTILRSQWVAPDATSHIPEGTELGFEGFERWVKILGRGDVVHGPVEEFPASERETLRNHGIRSLLLAPVFVAGEWWGYVGFDDCIEDREWSQIEIDALRAASSTIGAAIHRRYADARQRETEARYRQLVEHVPAISYIDVEDPGTSTWPTRYVSPQVERILGVEPSDWLADPTLWRSLVHEDDREAAVASDEYHYATGEPLDSEYRLVARDGSVVWVRDQATIVVDEDGRRTSQGVMIDITESKRAEFRLRDAEIRFRSIVESTPAITYQEHSSKDYSTEGSVLYVSPQVERLLGYPSENWEKIPGFWSTLLHPDDVDAVMAESERTGKTGQPYSQEYRMIAADGRIVWFRDDAVLLRDEHGRPSVWQGVMVDITERKKAEERVQHTEARFRALVENIPAVSYREAVDANPEDFYVSPQVLEVFGYTTEEWTWTPGFWRDRLHPDDRARVMEIDARTNATGEPYSAEYRFRRADGSYVWVHDQASLIGDEGSRFWQGFLLDITERKEAETALQEAEERYRTLIEQVPAVIYTQAIEEDGSTSTVYISPQQEPLLGYTVEEVYADPGIWRSQLHPDDRERVLAEDLRGNRTGEPFAMEYRMLTKDGRVVWIRDEASVVLDEEGRPHRWQGFMVDITERKQAEEQLERALEAEREATSRLRSLDEMKNTFLQAVSHDLRTPLAAILGLAVTLERADIDLEPEESRDLARRIATNARKLDRMVTDLLDLDRLARGIVEPKLMPTDVGALVARVVGDSDLMAQGRVAADTPGLTVNVDGSKVERIVENLLANTLRHTPAGTPVWVRVEAADGGALIVVEDSGPGVPEDLRDAIFQPFQQGPDAPEHSPGVGVGLTLVARFAELLGGRAWVQERPGGGASFRVFVADGRRTAAEVGAAG